MIYQLKAGYDEALTEYQKSLKIREKIGSPHANQAKKNIARVREKMPEEQFNAILKEFE